MGFFDVNLTDLASHFPAPILIRRDDAENYATPENRRRFGTWSPTPKRKVGDSHRPQTEPIFSFRMFGHWGGVSLVTANGP